MAGSEFRIERISAERWKNLSGFAHEAVFGKKKDPLTERISYAWLVIQNDKPAAYITVLELDSDTVYWQFGGAFPWAWNSRTVTKSYDLALSAQEAISRCIATRIENNNFAMLKLALSRKFMPIGIRTYQGSVLLELVRGRTDDAVSSDGRNGSGLPAPEPDAAG
jgi:hypothetical protein